MIDLNTRPYRDARDLERMLEMVTASAQGDGHDVGHLHRGDVIWGLFQNLTIDPTSRIVLAEDDSGNLRGFVWLHPPNSYTIHIAGQPDVTPEGVVTLVRAAEASLEGDPYTTDASTRLPVLAEGLRAAGYRRTGSAAYQLNAQPIAQALPEPVLPPEAAVRPVRLDDPAEVEARVDLHREVWSPSKFTVEGYARLRAMPVYRPDLDLVAVTPDGDLAAYCIVWWDPETGTGEFEPVGTSVRFRRQGYGRALLLGALGRLRELGAARAIVISGTDDGAEPARRLYASVGFRRVLQFDDWTSDGTSP